MKFSHTYKLNKDLPKYKAGWTLGWNGNTEKFYPHAIRKFDWEDKSKPDYCLDLEHQGYSLQEIKNEDWFSPVGKEKDFIPKFPARNKIEEFIYLDLETRLVDDIDEARALNRLFESKDFKTDLYNFIKIKYNKFHKLK